MYTANIVDTVVFRSVGKPPNSHFNALKQAVEQAGTEIWVPQPVHDELADHGVEPPENPYLDEGIREGWIRLEDPLPDHQSFDQQTTTEVAAKAWDEADAFLDRNSKYPTTNNWRDASLVALAVRLFEDNKQIRIIIHTADELLTKACASIVPEYGYYDVAARYYNPPRTAKHEFPTAENLSWDGR